MWYPPNKKYWSIGDLVIHAADEKKSHMLMQVVGYTKRGLCEVQYLHPGYFECMSNEILPNKLEVLLDPADFNIKTD